jgi:hypothetical protein
MPFMPRLNTLKKPSDVVQIERVPPNIVKDLSTVISKALEKFPNDSFAIPTQSQSSGDPASPDESKNAGGNCGSREPGVQPGLAGHVA